MNTIIMCDSCKNSVADIRMSSETVNDKPGKKPTKASRLLCCKCLAKTHLSLAFEMILGMKVLDDEETSYEMTGTPNPERN